MSKFSAKRCQSGLLIAIKLCLILSKSSSHVEIILELLLTHKSKVKGWFLCLLPSALLIWKNNKSIRDHSVQYVISLVIKADVPCLVDLIKVWPRLMGRSLGSWLRKIWQGIAPLWEDLRGVLQGGSPSVFPWFTCSQSKKKVSYIWYRSIRHKSDNRGLSWCKSKIGKFQILRWSSRCLGAERSLWEPWPHPILWW